MIRTTARVLSAVAAMAVLSGAAAAQQQPAKPQSSTAAKPTTTGQAQSTKPAARKPAASSETTAARAQAAIPPEQPTLLGQFGDWGAYTASPGGKKICFVIAKPTSSRTDPPNRPRDQPYFFISTRPAEKVKEEVSTVFGYPLKPDSANTVIGSTTFAMYAQNDGAWIKNAADEARMVDAMRKSGEMIVKGVSTRGTETFDTYSLRGISQALDRAAQECR